MNPGVFTTLVQIKYSMPCSLRPLLHHKILSVMTMLQARGYGEMRGTTFYKNPILAQTMLAAYGVDHSIYRSALQSQELRYGTTHSSSLKHHDIHRSIFNIDQDIHLSDTTTGHTISNNTISDSMFQRNSEAQCYSTFNLQHRSGHQL